MPFQGIYEGSIPSRRKLFWFFYKIQKPKKLTNFFSELFSGARMAEMVKAAGLRSATEMFVGSSPTPCIFFRYNHLTHTSDSWLNQESSVSYQGVMLSEISLTSKVYITSVFDLYKIHHEILN